MTYPYLTGDPDDVDLDWEPPLAALYGDPFHFRHFFHRKPAAFATKAAVLDAAKWNVRLIRDGAVVDVDHSRFELESNRSLVSRSTERPPTWFRSVMW